MHSISGPNSQSHFEHLQPEELASASPSHAASESTSVTHSQQSSGNVEKSAEEGRSQEEHTLSDLAHDFGSSSEPPSSLATPASAKNKKPTPPRLQLPGIGGPSGYSASSKPGKPKLTLPMGAGAAGGPPKLKPLTISTQPSASAGKNGPASPINKQQTLDAMSGMKRSKFERASDAPSYETFQSGVGAHSDHYNVYPEKYFTTANRKTTGEENNLEEESNFEGHKIHLSVDKANTKQAFEAAAPLLFSKDSPVEKFKMTNMESAEEHQEKELAQRVSEGGQFTLYLKPNPKTNQFDAEHMKKVSDFVQDLNQSFAENDVKPGRRPESDAPLAGGFASFRTEDAARTKQGAEAVKQDPVYQVLHEHQSSL